MWTTLQHKACMFLYMFERGDRSCHKTSMSAQVFEHVDMVTTDILATFLMAAAAQQCKRRSAVVQIVGQGEEPLRLEATSTQLPSMVSARCIFACIHTYVRTLQMLK